MIGRRIRGHAAWWLMLVIVVLPFLASCGGDAGKYAGQWRRELVGEGEVQMKLASNGRMELMLPSPRWPDDVDMRGRAAFKGDTITFKADTTALRCQTADARYIISRQGNELQIRGLGIDSCGGRHAALVGRWEKA